MSADLSPAEQARAAWWAAEWLSGVGFGGCYDTGSDVVNALRAHANRLVPPETVESLRAELRQNRAELEDNWRTILNLRDQLEQAKEENLLRCAQSTHAEAEAAWERCQREPRVWHKGGGTE